MIALKNGTSVHWSEWHECFCPAGWQRSLTFERVMWVLVATTTTRSPSPMPMNELRSYVLCLLLLLPCQFDAVEGGVVIQWRRFENERGGGAQSVCWSTLCINI